MSDQEELNENHGYEKSEERDSEPLIPSASIGIDCPGNIKYKSAHTLCGT